jgi:hypothetical protein
MVETDIQWRHGLTVRLSIADDVLDPDLVLNAVTYSLLFARDDRGLDETLPRELAPLGLEVTVVESDPGDAVAPILVKVRAAERAWTTWLERRQMARTQVFE